MLNGWTRSLVRGSRYLSSVTKALVPKYGTRQTIRCVERAWACMYDEYEWKGVVHAEV